MTETKYGDLVSDGPDGNDFVIASWTERPYTSHKRRSWRVEHRVVAEAHEDVGVDIRHEVRCQDNPDTDGWKPAEIYEARAHGIDKIKAKEEWWQ